MVEDGSLDQTVYLACVESTKMWMVTSEHPKSGFYREYRFAERDFDTAIGRADDLVESYQGKTPDEVELPESLTE